MILLRSRLRLPWLSILLFLIPSTSTAMTVVERDFSELVERAEQVVVGTVTAITAGRDANGGPLTLVSFGDLTVLKGQVGTSFTLELTGGVTDDGRVLSIPDMPQFTVGERAVLFVAGNGRDLCPLVGVWQGRFRVVHDPDSGVDVVQRSDGARVTGLEGRALRTTRSVAAGNERPLSLPEFETLIREELAR